MCGDMLVIMTFLLILATSSLAEDQRTCYKCRVKNKCHELDPSSYEVCRPDVQHCVKKTILSKVTGATVTERYCGARDFLDIGSGLVEDKCYTVDIRERTSATVCYCSSDYCNSSYRGMPSVVMLVSFLMANFVL